MPDNWINRRLLTGADGIYDKGAKVHDLVDLSAYGGDVVDETDYPLLGSKLVRGVAIPTFDIEGWSLRAGLRGQQDVESSTDFEVDVYDANVVYTDNGVNCANGRLQYSTPIDAKLDDWTLRFTYSSRIDTYNLGVFALAGDESVANRGISLRYNGGAPNNYTLVAFNELINAGFDFKEVGVDVYVVVTHSVALGQYNLRVWFKDVKVVDVSLTDASVPSGNTNLMLGFSYGGASTVGEAGIKDMLLFDYIVDDEELLLGKTYYPSMTPPTGSPHTYKIIAEPTTPSIGDVRKTASTKYTEDGVSMFDMLLADGSKLDVGLYPLLASTLEDETRLSPTESFPWVTGISDLTWNGDNYWETNDSGIISYVNADYTYDETKNITGAIYTRGVDYRDGVIYTLNFDKTIYKDGNSVVTTISEAGQVFGIAKVRLGFVVGNYSFNTLTTYSQEGLLISSVSLSSLGIGGSQVFRGISSTDNDDVILVYLGNRVYLVNIYTNVTLGYTEVTSSGEQGGLTAFGLGGFMLRSRSGDVIKLEAGKYLPNLTSTTGTPYKVVADLT